MNKDLKEALQMLEWVHASIWTYFDPGMDRGAKDQPKEIKEILKRMRQYAKTHGYTFDGWR
jgi:hypothetical protein